MGFNLMFQLKLYNDNLSIKYIKNIRSSSSDGECAKNPHYISSKNIGTVDITKRTFKINYKIIFIQKNGYMIYNEKNQAIIDNTIFNILNHFNIKTIRNQELLELLYELEFIINE
jgi:hypothetical protein